MAITKQMNIKNETYYFYNDLINIQRFWSKVVKTRQKIIQKH